MMMDVGGQPLIVRTLEQAKAIPGIQTVVLATTNDDADQILLQIAEEQGVVPFAGSLTDVLDRYYQAASLAGADAVMRLTGDCPLIDPAVCQEVLNRFLSGEEAYVSNVRPPTYPDGLDTEIFSFEALECAWNTATLPSDREHVSQYIWRNPDQFPNANVSNDDDLSSLRWTVDEPQDIEFVRSVYESLAKRGLKTYGFREVLNVILEDELQDPSLVFERNEGQIRALDADGLDYAKEMEQFTTVELDD